LIDVLVIE
jgi:hypothetical protein